MWRKINGAIFATFTITLYEGVIKIEIRPKIQYRIMDEKLWVTVTVDRDVE